MAIYLYGNSVETLDFVQLTTGFTTGGLYNSAHVSSCISLTALSADSSTAQRSRPFTAPIDAGWAHMMLGYSGNATNSWGQFLTLRDGSDVAVGGFAFASASTWAVRIWNGTSFDTILTGPGVSYALAQYDMFFDSDSGNLQVYANQILLGSYSGDLSALAGIEALSIAKQANGGSTNTGYASEIIVSDEPTLFKFVKQKVLSANGSLTGYTSADYTSIKGPAPSTATYIYSDTAAQEVSFSTATIATGNLATSATQAKLSLSLMPASSLTAIAFRAVGTFAAGTTSATPALPTGWAADDICLLYIETNAGETLGGLTGWTAVTNSPQSTSDTMLSVYWRRMVIGDVAPTITATPGDHIAARIIAFSGCIATGTPYRASTGATAAVAANAVAFPVVETQSDDMWVGIVSSGTDTTTSQFSAFTGTELSSTGSQSAWTTTGGGGGCGIGYGLVSAGVSGYQIDCVGIAFGYQSSGVDAPPDLTPMLVESGTNYYSDTVEPQFGWLYSLANFTQNPITSADWTPGEATSSLLELGFRSAAAP